MLRLLISPIMYANARQNLNLHELVAHIPCLPMVSPGHLMIGGARRSKGTGMGKFRIHIGSANGEDCAHDVPEIGSAAKDVEVCSR